MSRAMQLVASTESTEGARVEIRAGGRVVEIVIPGAPEIALRFGPRLTRQFAHALLIAADRGEADAEVPFG